MDQTHATPTGAFRITLPHVGGVLALGAAAFHLAAAPAHFEEWWGYGWFFLLVAGAQAAYGLGLLAPRSQFASSRGYLMAGALGSVVLVMLYVASRTVGIPLMGPHAGHVEALGSLDLLSKAVEVGLATVLAVLLLRQERARGGRWLSAMLAGLFLLVITGTLVLTAGRVASTAGQDVDASIPGLSAQQSPEVKDLLAAVTRQATDPSSTVSQVVYAPPALFTMAQGDLPRVDLDRPSVVFFITESEHRHSTVQDDDDPRFSLRVDNGEAITPYQVQAVAEEGSHRVLQVLFPVSSAVAQSLDQGAHVLSLTVGAQAAASHDFTWELPLAQAAASGTVTAEGSTLRAALTRTVPETSYGGATGIEVAATYATADYLATALAADVVLRYEPAKNIVLMLTETSHGSSLPGSAPYFVLTIDGQSHRPDLLETLTTSSHHRVSLARFPVAPPQGSSHRLMELRLPQGATMEWHFPLLLPTSTTAPAGGFQLTFGFVLALFGGMLAAMWPCLFQLTVFFIPALGGLSMHDTASPVPVKRRMSVVRAAFFFILGFTLVYTIAGALLGFAAQQVGNAEAFKEWQRYFAIGGGLIIIVLALRVAAKVRAPLVCKMPFLSKVAHDQKPASPVEMMVAGLAFATGCMTCFGAALIVAMVVYVGLQGSPLVGALTMFLFSLGMGIPLVIAATFMAKVLPTLTRLERIVPWMGLAASVVMIAFAVLLISGNYMVVSEWFFRMFPSTGTV